MKTINDHRNALCSCVYCMPVGEMGLMNSNACVLFISKYQDVLSLFVKRFRKMNIKLGDDYLRDVVMTFIIAGKLRTTLSCAYLVVHCTDVYSTFLLFLSMWLMCEYF